MANNNRSSRDKSRKKKNRRGGRKWFKNILLTIILVGIIGLLAGGALFAYYASDAPEMTDDDLMGTFSSELLDINGESFYTLGAEQRDFASASDYPDIVKNAFMAIEDQRFESHIGIDPIGISRAAFGFITNRGQIAGGGSTITQQLVKLSVFSTLKEDQTLERKAQEAWLAIQLERQLTKEQILALYLNKIYLSGNVYGVATAAEEFYHKPVQELELHEAALFAGMAQAPNRYNPYENPEAAENRRNVVLSVMAEIDMITEEEAEAAKAIDVQEGLQARKQDEDENYLVFDGYLRAVLDEVSEKTDFNPYTAGLQIQTNLDMDAQEELFDILNNNERVNFPNEEMQAASSLIDVETGQVTAMIGGRHQEGQLSTNYATHLDRNVGSTIKPLTTYGPAIEYLQYSTYHQIIDESYSYNGWSPRNYDSQYRGQGSLRDYLVDSRNVPAAKIFNEDLDMAEVEGFLSNLGIDASELNSDGGPYPQNAINGQLTPLQLAASFAAFANEGYYTEPYTVSKVITQDGVEYDLTPDTNRAMSDYTAYMITDVLKGVVETSFNRLDIPGLIHAGKTGTTNYTGEQHQQYNIPSNGVPDSWYVGYSRNYSLSVWVGYPNQFDEGNYLTFQDGTRHLPRDVYRSFMTYMHQNLEGQDWIMPDSVVEVEIEDGTNPAKRPGPNTPDTAIVSELFVKGTEPGSDDVSLEFGESLEEPSGLSAEYNEETDELIVSWDEYELDSTEEEVTYLITIDGQSTTTSETEFRLSEPPEGNIEISLAVEAYGNTGPPASITILIARDEEEDDEEDPDDEDNEGEDMEDDADAEDIEDENGNAGGEQENEDENDQPNDEEENSSPGD